MDQPEPDPVPEPSWLRTWTPRIAFVALVTFAIGAATTWTFVQVSGFIMTIVMSLFIAFALSPGVDRLARRGWKRGWATGLVMLVTIAVVLVFVFAFVSLLVDQAVLLGSRLSRWLNALGSWLDELGISIDPAELASQRENIRNALISLSDNVVGVILGVGSTLLGAIFSALTMGLFVFYMLAQAPQLRRAVVRPFNPNLQKRITVVWDEASRQTGNYIYSRGLLAGISAVFHTVAFWIIGLPSPLALGLFVGVVSQFVPNIGTYIAGALPTIVALASGDVSQAIWVIVIVVAYQQLENIVLANKITAQTMNLHPAVAFGSVIMGASLLGASGALLALPVAATIQALVTAWLAHRDDADPTIDPVESGFISPE